MVTIELHCTQPFGPEWTVNELHKRALSDASSVAQRWASEFTQGKAMVLKVDPNITIVMQEQR